jgi:hypothetical protein
MILLHEQRRSSLYQCTTSVSSCPSSRSRCSWSRQTWYPVSGRPGRILVMNESMGVRQQKFSGGFLYFYRAQWANLQHHRDIDCFKEVNGYYFANFIWTFYNRNLLVIWYKFLKWISFTYLNRSYLAFFIAKTAIRPLKILSTVVVFCRFQPVVDQEKGLGCFLSDLVDLWKLQAQILFLELKIKKKKKKNWILMFFNGS